MKNIQNEKYSSLFDNLRLEVKENGHAFCDKDWTNNNICGNNIFSRLYYIKDGSGIVETENQKIEMVPGNLYFLPIGTEYSCSCAYMEKMYFHINIFLQGNENFYDIFFNCKQIVTLPCDYVDKLLDLYEKNDIISFLKIKGILYNDVIRIIQQIDYNDINIKAYSEFCCNVINYVKENLSAKLKIKDIAKHMLISESKLSKQFLHETGISLGKYIDDKLFWAVENDIAKTEATVSQISEKFKFCDDVYFSRFFKRKTGYTPRQYRFYNTKKSIQYNE